LECPQHDESHFIIKILPRIGNKHERPGDIVDLFTDGIPLQES
jgi:hypothetical protein